MQTTSCSSIKDSPCGSSLLFRWTFWGYPSCVFFLLLTAIPHANPNNDDKHYSSYNTTHYGACVIFLLSWFCCKINKMKIKKQIPYGPRSELFEVAKSAHSSRPFPSCHSTHALILTLRSSNFLKPTGSFRVAVNLIVKPRPYVNSFSYENYFVCI